MCALQEVADGALGEGELLTRVVAGLLESVVVETPVVAMVMLDSYAVLGGEGLKDVLGG